LSPTAAKGKGDSQPVVLLRIAGRLFDIRRTSRGDVVGIAKRGARVVRPLRGNGPTVSSALVREFLEAKGKPPAPGSMATALAALHAEAQEQPEIAVHLRVARHADEIVIDMGDDTGRVIVIGGGSWKLLNAPPDGVYFFRTTLTRPMVMPKRPGDLRLLYDAISADGRNVDLIVSWLACVWLLPEYPVPVLSLMGINGVAKSYTAKTLVRLVDPSKPVLRTTPRNPHEWVITADSSRVVGLDNISNIPEWLSDAICRAVTGDGFATRALYTDASLYATEFHRAILLTSIDPGGLRGDLGERLLPVELGAITEDARELEAHLQAKLEQILPRVLAALLDLAAYVQAHPIRPKKLPRMADSAAIMAAVDAKLGSHALEAYYAAQAAVTITVLESDPVAAALVGFMNGKSVWRGTMTQLKAELDVRRTDANWPANARSMSARIKRIVPQLRACRRISR
jgi:hypothetical protein